MGGKRTNTKMQGRCRYTYAEGDVPGWAKGDGRPARFDLRLTCSDRARLIAVLGEFRREYFAGRGGVSLATIVAERCLPVLEHHVRTLKVGDTATAAFIRAQSEPIPKRDHLRSVYKRLKSKFEPNAEKSAARPKRAKR